MKFEQIAQRIDDAQNHPLKDFVSKHIAWSTVSQQPVFFNTKVGNKILEFVAVEGLVIGYDTWLSIVRMLPAFRAAQSQSSSDGSFRTGIHSTNQNNPVYNLCLQLAATLPRNKRTVASPPTPDYEKMTLEKIVNVLRIHGEENIKNVKDTSILDEQLTEEFTVFSIILHFQLAHFVEKVDHTSVNVAIDPNTATQSNSVRLGGIWREKTFNTDLSSAAAIMKAVNNSTAQCYEM